MYLFFFLLFTSAVGLQAQPYKIRLVDKGNQKLAVEMRITAGTAPTTASQIVDLKFGVRWLASTNTRLGTVVQNVTGSYGIVKSGSETQKTVGATVYKFQTFSANAFPYFFPRAWVVGTWVEMMSTTVTSSASVVSFEVCPTGFDGTAERNLNVDLTDYSPDIETNSNVVIPLDLLSFQAVRTANEAVLLTWQTVNEQNMTHYALERRADTQDWGPLSIIAAKNGSQQNYTFEDTKPLENINYYRLKMVDKDGTFRYSAIKSVDKDKTPIVKMSPNPLNLGNALHITATTDVPFKVTVTDALGRFIASSTFMGETWLPTTEWACGIYFVQSTANGRTETHKLLIQ